MGNKRLRNVEKRKAQEAAAAPVVLMPKPSIVKHLKPAFVQRLEAPVHVPLQFYSALERLRLGVGDAITFQLLFSRLMFGRIIAHDYFDDEVAAHIHYSVQTIVVCAHETVEGNGSSKAGDYTNLKISEDECDDIRECLRTIEEMTTKITPTEYELSGIKMEHELHRNHSVLTTVNMVSYEDFMISQGW